MLVGICIIYGNVVDFFVLLSLLLLCRFVRRLRGEDERVRLS